MADSGDTSWIQNSKMSAVQKGNALRQGISQATSYSWNKKTNSWVPVPLPDPDRATSDIAAATLAIGVLQDRLSNTRDIQSRVSDALQNLRNQADNDPCLSSDPAYQQRVKVLEEFLKTLNERANALSNVIQFFNKYIAYLKNSLNSKQSGQSGNIAKKTMGKAGADASAGGKGKSGLKGKNAKQVSGQKKVCKK
jgi:hypothetical protein